MKSATFMIDNDILERGYILMCFLIETFSDG